MFQETRIASLKHLLPALVAIALMVGLVEISLRVVATTDLRLAYYLEVWESRRFGSQIDPISRVNLLKPHVEFTELSPDGEFVTFRGDSLGLRNDVDFERQPIVALGDSFTAGSGVGLDERWSNRLEDIPAEDVYNVGSNLSGPCQQALLLRRVLESGAGPPDRIIWMIYSGNDVSDCFEFSTGTRPRISPPNAVATALLDWSYTARLTYILFRLVNKARSVRSASSGQRFKVLGKPFDFFLLGDSSYRKSDAFRDGFAALAQAVHEVATEVRLHGGRLLLAYAPSKEEAFAAILTQEHAVDPNRILSLEADFLELCSNESLDCVSLLPRFRHETSAGQTLYFQHDGHWNPRGNAIAAEVISEHLR